MDAPVGDDCKKQRNRLKGITKHFQSEIYSVVGDQKQLEGSGAVCLVFSGQTEWRQNVWGNWRK